MLIRSAVLLCVSGAWALGQPTADNASDVEEVRLHTGGAGEYKTFFELPGLTDEQRKAAEEKLEARNASLQQFNDSEQGKQLIALRTELAAARRNKETAKVAPLREQIQPLADAYLALRHQGRIEILSVLTPEQLASYASRAVRVRAMRGIESIELTPEQSEQVAHLCLDAAKKHFESNTLADDPFFNKTEPLAAQVRGRIVEQVLSDEQRESLKRPSSAPAGDE